MRKISVISLFSIVLISTTLAFSQSSKQQILGPSENRLQQAKPKNNQPLIQEKKSDLDFWEFISEDKINSIVHEADLTNIHKDKDGLILFLHRLKFIPPKNIQGKEITHIITMTALNCSSRMTLVLGDIAYNKNEKIATDLISAGDSPSVATSGSPHYKIVMKICGPSANMT